MLNRTASALACCLLGLTTASCFARLEESPEPPNPTSTATEPTPSKEEPNARSVEPSLERNDPEPSQTSCLELRTPQPETTFDDLQIEYACGVHSSYRTDYSEFVVGGTPCESVDGLNTFALRLTGSAASEYSAVVRCGYIRYDNGVFVGTRVEVEARDGQWCHEPALEQIELVDRMLLTDVSFAIEAIGDAAPERHLSVQFSTRAGWTEPVPSETSLCAYVAHREPGYAACGMVSPAPYCACPCGGAWQDFFNVMKLSLASS